MGGSIRVESKKNVGTTVFFSLPLGKGKESDLKVEVSGSVDARALMGKKILITDDNEMNRLLANTILKQYGAILDEAQNGVEAIEKIRKNSYDVVLMDVQMPVMDGIQATRIIRETISSKLPVIALTALALKGDESKFLEAGMSGYLSKPFDENQILHVITNCLGQPQGPVQISGAALQNGSLYDLAKLNEIARGDTAFVEKMARIFISQAPQSVLEITEAYNLKDLEKMGKVAHRFKTSLMNMGVGSLKEDINRIEDMGQTNQDGESLGSMITHVGQIVRQVVEELSVQFKE
jgi:CheY-like chemotaxis protein